MKPCIFMIFIMSYFHKFQFGRSLASFSGVEPFFQLLPFFSLHREICEFFMEITHINA